jgi:hypothetical protein
MRGEDAGARPTSDGSSVATVAGGARRSSGAVEVVSGGVETTRVDAAS